MKKLTQVLFIMLISFGSASALMVEDPEALRIKVTTNGSGIFNLKYKIMEPGTVAVKILNEKGVVIHKDKVKTEKSFERKYNLQNYSSGTYKFQVTDENSTQEFEVKYDKAHGIELNRIDDTRLIDLKVSVPNQHLVVNIYDKKGNVIQRESIKTSYEGARRIYNLKKLKAGETVVEVVNNFEVVKRIDM